MKIEEFVNDQLVDVLNKYSEEPNKVGTVLRQAINNSENKEMIVPVLGMQGLGKSTLINALLRENILPSEVDETTCVPVEVKYGEEEKAEVHFENKSDITIVHTQAELAERVGVSHEFIRRNESKKGKKSFSVDTVWKISLAVDVEPGKLFEIDMDELINQ